MQKEIPCPDCGTMIKLELDLLFAGATFKCSACPVEIKIHRKSLDGAAKAYSDFNQIKVDAESLGPNGRVGANGHHPKSDLIVPPYPAASGISRGVRDDGLSRMGLASTTAAPVGPVPIGAGALGGSGKWGQWGRRKRSALREEQGVA